MGMLHCHRWVIHLSLGPDKITGSLDNCDPMLSPGGRGNKVVWVGQFTHRNPLTWSCEGVSEPGVGLPARKQGLFKVSPSLCT